MNGTCTSGTDTQVIPSVESQLGDSGPSKPLIRHIVEREPDSNDYKQEALCGFMWDAIHLKDTGAICEECAKIYRQRACE